MRRGAELRAGFGALHGTARPIDGRAGERLCTSTRTEASAGRVARSGEAQVTAGAPFALVLASGEEIEVDPTDATLKGLPTSTSGDRLARDARQRWVVMRLSAGDEVWATGVLSPPEAPRPGAYRDGSPRRRLGAPRGGHVEITTESPLPRWQRLATAHGDSAVLALALWVLHGLFYVDMTSMHGPPAPCATILADPRYVQVLLSGGLFAVAVVAAGWHGRVKRRGRPAKSG